MPQWAERWRGSVQRGAVRVEWPAHPLRLGGSGTRRLLHEPEGRGISGTGEARTAGRSTPALPLLPLCSVEGARACSTAPWTLWARAFCSLRRLASASASRRASCISSSSLVSCWLGPRPRLVLASLGLFRQKGAGEKRRRRWGCVRDLGRAGRDAAGKKVWEGLCRRKRRGAGDSGPKTALPAASRVIRQELCKKSRVDAPLGDGETRAGRRLLCRGRPGPLHTPLLLRHARRVVSSGAGVPSRRDAPSPATRRPAERPAQIPASNMRHLCMARAFVALDTARSR